MGLDLDVESAKSPTVIIQGQDGVINFQLKNKKHCKPQDRYPDISGASEIVLILQNTAPSSYLELKLTDSAIAITNGPFGQFAATYTAVQSALLLLSPIDANTQLPLVSDGELKITIGGKTPIYNLTGQFQIIAPRFPAAP